MTILYLFSSVFFLLLYPFLIKTLGPETYGLYVYCTSIIGYFLILINFGFDYPAVKAVALHKKNLLRKSKIVSCVLYTKCYLAIIASAIFIVALFFSGLYTYKLLLTICFLQSIHSILFPTWFFQGIQKMKIVTGINVLVKILSLPFIFLYVQTPDDLITYAIIIIGSTILGSLFSLYVLFIKEKIVLVRCTYKESLSLCKDALPFFWSSSAGLIKQQSVTVIIGSCFGMFDVALYDLAYKIIQIPQLATMNINGALFPRLINELTSLKIRKIIKYETYIGLLAVLGVILLGKFAVLILGGEHLIDAYYMSIVLSVTVYTWLIVGCYINYIFVPSNHYYYVTRNQVVAFFSFFVFTGIGLLLIKSVWIIVVALTLSGLTEVFYCHYIVRKHNLLNIC